MRRERVLETPMTIVVPMFQETHRAAAGIASLVGYVASLPPASELIFVDDGSTDGTPDLVDKLLAGARPFAHVLRRPHLGKGAAVRAGLEAATTPLVGFCDIDLATPLSSFTEIALAAERAPVLAIGSRDLVGSRVLRHESVAREFLGRAYNRVVQSLLTPGIVDTQCGAKVARRELWERILPSSREEGFAWDVEACALAVAAGIGVLEVAIDWRHDDGSNINVATDGMRMIAALPRIRRRVRRFERDHRRHDASTASALSLRSDTAVARSTAALLVGMLRRAESATGVLVDIDAGSTSVTTRLGWEPRRVVGILRSAEPPAAVAIGLVRAEPSDLPLPPRAAHVVLMHDTERDTPLGLDDDSVAEAARVLADGGVLIALLKGASPREVSGRLRAAGLSIELSCHAFSWTSARSISHDLGSWRTMRGDATTRWARASLFASAAERIAIERLGLRPPRGAAALVVARRLNRS